MNNLYQNSAIIFTFLIILIVFNNLLLKNNNILIYLITILLVLALFVYVIILYIQYYILKEKYAFKQNSCNGSVNTNNNINSWQAPYSTLDNINVNDGWEITKAKKCCGVNLDWLDKNSELYKYCSNPNNQDAISRYCCESSGINGEQGCKGFNGKPLSFEYSSETNSNWQNGRTSKPLHSDLMPPIL